MLFDFFLYCSKKNNEQSDLQLVKQQRLRGRRMFISKWDIYNLCLLPKPRDLERRQAVTTINPEAVCEYYKEMMFAAQYRQLYL